MSDSPRSRSGGARRVAAAAASLLVLLCAGPAAADTTKVVSFDDLPPNTVVADQYKGSSGVYFAGPDAGDGLFPVTRTLAGLARSGSQVADFSTCFACEFFTPGTVGRFVESPKTVSAFVGFVDQPPPDLEPAQVTLTARDEAGGLIASSNATVVQGQPFDQEVSVTSTTTPIASFDLLASPPNSNQPLGLDDLSLTFPDVKAPPGFSIATSSEPASVPQGDSVEVPIFLNRLNGSDGDIALGVSGLPAGMSASFSPNPVPGTDGTATLKLTADAAAVPSPYAEIAITGTPTAGAGSAPRTTTRLVRIVENCVREFRTDFLDVRSEACMRTAGPGVLVATGQTVRVNGLALTPRTGSQRLVINKQKRTISSAITDQIAVTLADHPNIPLYVGDVDWDLGTPGGGAKKIFEYMGKDVIVLQSLPVQKVAVSLTKQGKAQVSPTFKLSFWPFNYFGAISATSGFTADNDRGTDFSALEIKVDRLEALGVALKDVSIKWKEGGTWAGSGTLTLRFASAYSLSAGIGIKEGGLDFLRGAVGNLNAAVSPGVFLQSIGFGVERNPLALSGTIGLSAGPSVAGKKAVEVNGTFKATIADPLVFEVNGSAKLANKFNLGDVFLRYSSTGLFELGGKVNWDLSVAYVNGQVSGFVDGFDAASLEGAVQACVRIKWAPDPCAGAAFLVSNIGIAACVDLFLGQAGVGYRWGGSFDLFWGSCDLGPWRPARGAGSSALASATSRFPLRAGLPAVAFAVEGEGGSPGVTLTGPGGQKVSVSATEPAARAGRLFAVQAGNDTTYVVVKRPAAGTWTLTDDGTVPVRRVRQALGLPRPFARAGVSGRGHARVLHWRLRPIEGQRVRFVEVGRDVRNVIATTSAPRGAKEFRPADGPAGKRRIVVLVEQNGLPRTSLRVGSYRAPGTLRPARAQRLRVTRRGKRLVVTWRAPRAGFRHAVYLRRSDDVRLLRVASPRQREVVFPGVPRGYGATVTVTGLTNGNGKGPTAQASIKGALPKRPAAGRWKLSSRFGYAGKGSLGISARGTVTALRLTPGSAANAACGRRELKVVGSHRPSRATRSGLAVWAVGRPSLGSGEGVAGVSVAARRGKKRLRGKLTLVFDSPLRGSGELELKGCRLSFEVSRGRAG